jgi:tetratricopeptide (TPR) repeat protein
VHAARNLPGVHIRLGDQALSAGNRASAEREYARVIHLYRQAMGRWAEDASLRNGLAWFYVRRRVNLDEAFRLAQEALSLDPRSWEVVDTIAEIYYVRGNLPKAREFAGRALELDPENAYLASQVARFENAIQERGMR